MNRANLATATAVLVSSFAIATLLWWKPCCNRWLWHQAIPSSSRFMLVFGGEAQLDKETGLIWETQPDATTEIWTSALRHCYSIAISNRMGWRLPTIEELASLVDPTQNRPALPSGHPFQGVQSGESGGTYYWSSNTVEVDIDPPVHIAWTVLMDGGSVVQRDKTQEHHTWCVRMGQGHDADWPG